MALGKKKIQHQAADTGLVNTENFAPVVYTGNGGTKTVSGVGFQADFLWIKNRTDVVGHRIYDVTRGLGGTEYYYDSSSTDLSLIAGTGGVTAVNSDGFTVGAGNAHNGSGDNIVAWCWKAGGTPVSGTGTGGITNVTYSANTDAGFSIVEFEGSGTAGTVTHGLTAAPELIIFKNQDTASHWDTYNVTVGATKRLQLSSDGAASTANAAFFNNTDPSSTVFSVGTGLHTNGNNDNITAYCFHSVDGYQKIGTYTGNGTVLADNQDITTGFQPRFVLIKCTSSGSTNWVIVDSERENGDKWLYANLTDAEYDDANTYITFNSSGFNTSSQSAFVNKNNETFIYLAIA